MIATLLVVSFLTLALSALLGLTLARSAARPVAPPPSSPRQAVGTVAALVPASRVDPLLHHCLRSLAAAATPDLIHVVVVLPGGLAPLMDASVSFPKSVRVEFIDATSHTGKAAAVLYGLRHVNADWVVLLDSDTMMRPDGLSRLADLRHGDIDAAYGVVRPCRRARRPVLDLVVDLDKALSHGVFRAGRAALGLWPNLPGQCYIIRSSLLRHVYSGRMGYLDDLIVTLRLVSLGGQIVFLPNVVADEEARETWSGYVLQRARWTIGLLQAGLDVTQVPGRRRWAAVAWALHAWLYYGWPLAMATAVGVLTAFGLWRPALMLGLCHASIWGYLALRGRENLARWESRNNDRALEAPTCLVAAGIVSIIPCLGAAAAVVLGLFDCLGRRRLARWLYIR